MVLVRARQLFFPLDPGELRLAADGYRHGRKAVDGRPFGVLAGKLANDRRERRGFAASLVPHGLPQDAIGRDHQTAKAASDTNAIAAVIAAAMTIVFLRMSVSLVA
jgi:hypothetical protein